MDLSKIETLNGTVKAVNDISGQIQSYKHLEAGKIDVPQTITRTLVDSDYNNLENKPTINSVPVEGDKDGGDYNLATVHYDTTEHWNAQLDLVGQKNHVYIYTDYGNVDGVDIAAIKIGDGSAYLIDAPFISGNLSSLRQHTDNASIHITDDERFFWNDKVTCFMSANDGENIVFTKENLLNG